MSTNASSARGPLRWSQRASTPLPLPVSPSIRIGLLEAATLRASSASRRIAAEVPVKGSTASRAWRARPAAWRRFSRWLSSSRRSITSSAGSSTGFARNWSAPSLTARTARSIVAWPVSTTTGRVESISRILRQQLERRAVGQHVVEHHRVGVELAHRLLGGGAGVGLLHVEALALEKVPDPEADPGLVVDDQDLRQGAFFPARIVARAGGEGF